MNATLQLRKVGYWSRKAARKVMRLFQYYRLLTRADPLAELLTSVMFSYSIGTRIIFDHNVGGGGNRYSHNLINAIVSEGCTVLRIYYFKRFWFVEFVSADDGMIFKESSAENLFEVLAKVVASGLIVNSLHLYPKVDKIIELIVNLARSSGLSVDYKVHDYYSICSSQHLLDNEERYCGVPQNINACNSCLRKNKFSYWLSSQPVDIIKWRQPFVHLLEIASRITLFDPSSVDIMKQAFDIDDAKVRIVPHKHESFKHVQPIRLNGSLHIGVFGTLTAAKGSEVINKLAEHILAQGQKIPITIVGRSEVLTAYGIKVMGNYDLDELPHIVDREGINMFLMASIIPETFSYTISEAMRLGLPIVAFDIGAQGRRVKAYRWGRVATLDVSPDDLINIINEVYLLTQV